MLCDNLEEWDGVGGGKEIQVGGEGDICVSWLIPGACMAVTNTIL